jgi:hypothetical protein
MAQTLAAKPPREELPEPSDVKEVSSGSGVSLAAAKVVIDKVLGRGEREGTPSEKRNNKASDKTPAGVA